MLVPEGRLSSDLIVDDSPLKDLSWDRVFCDGPEGNAAKLHRDVTLRTYRTTEYHVLHTGGFLRLCTMRGRMYWLAQNQTGHITPDWKLHFSVELQDIPQAWDLLAALFLERGCEVGMKATYAHLRDESYWSSAQRGREITLYIYTHDKAFEEAQEDDCCLWLGTEYERRGYLCIHTQVVEQARDGLLFVTVVQERPDFLPFRVLPAVQPGHTMPHWYALLKHGWKRPEYALEVVPTAILLLALTLHCETKPLSHTRQCAKNTRSRMWLLRRDKQLAHW